VTERPLGPLMEEILRERSRFNLEEVLQLMTPLAGAFDLATAFACRPNLVSASALFVEKWRSSDLDSEPRSISEWPLRVKLDIWELARPRVSISWSSFASDQQKAS